MRFKTFINQVVEKTETPINRRWDPGPNLKSKTNGICKTVKSISSKLAVSQKKAIIGQNDDLMELRIRRENKNNPNKIKAKERTQLNGHRGRIIWMTGLSGAGKSTISLELERRLFDLGMHTYRLDGDELRTGLNKDLGFSNQERNENIRRIGEVAKMFADAGIICIAASISPHHEYREIVRKLVPRQQFIEVFVNAPLEVCEQRDPKGLYAKARAGIIQDFTGVSAPYEAPTSPEIELRTDEFSVSECVQQVLDYLQAHPLK